MFTTKGVSLNFRKRLIIITTEQSEFKQKTAWKNSCRRLYLQFIFLYGFKINVTLYLSIKNNLKTQPNC